MTTRSFLIDKELYHDQENVSAEQDSAQADPGISCPVQDQERPRRAQAQALQGAQEIIRLRFPGTNKLTRRPQYLACYARGRRFFSKNFILFSLLRDRADDPFRMGLAVSKKMGPAVRRNRAKRLLREFFRLHRHEMPRGLDLVVVPKRGTRIQDWTLAQVTEELLPLVQRAGAEKERSVK